MFGGLTRSLTSPGMATAASGGGATGKMSVYRQQLMEVRMAEEEDMRERKTLENLVKQLQSELQDRDKVITNLKEDMMSVASFTTASPFVMSPETGRSPTNL